MHTINGSTVEQSLTFPSLISALDQGLAAPFHMPQRQLFHLNKHAAYNQDFALLPCWSERLIAVKAFTYFPGNAERGLGGLHSQVLLFDRRTGESLACIDGRCLTHWRTAAVSALASRYLSNPDSKTLLVLGTGNLVPYLVRAHCHIRPLDKVIIWGRNEQKSARLANLLNTELEKVAVCSHLDIEQAAQDADIIVSATGSPLPLLFGNWIQPGTHVDLLGNHNPDQRECDTALIKRARCFADSLDNVRHEAGEYLLALNEGAIESTHFSSELADLVRGKCPGRTSLQEITLFKSVGMAIADLLTAGLVLERQFK
ncbi:ornithine cyclodeaminase family protein [Simiduia agarivorans]|uniref:Ornithine cyclodeaminase n=1 Tax=Simiduia agarivorans (strain DSM 21679 / JCM 13881 / BCRC 17597 / SA1) TaxID=1117647 RepID=K4KJ06_SIMAS|nr:ornithine cyclodeaminase family protein [Simiduia agarivorans]AFU97968.1 ornithine cyclodeaminase [Simiduia agarivorans SA1 = DSM 21679]